MRKTILSAAAMLASSVATAATWYVGTGTKADDDEGYGASVDKPFASLEYAVSQASAEDEIVIEPGVYNQKNEITVDKKLTITGGAGVFLNGVVLATTVRFMIIDHPDAVVDGICFSNHTYNVSNTSARRSGVMVQVLQGTLKNSVVAKCTINGNQDDGALSNEGGNIIDCEVTAITRGGNVWKSYSNGFRQNGGTTTRLKVNKCKQMAVYGSAVALSGGTIDGALIEGNGIEWGQNIRVQGSGVWMNGGEIKNSIIR